jgi:hypothetical protein
MAMRGAIGNATGPATLTAAECSAAMADALGVSFPYLALSKDANGAK